MACSKRRLQSHHLLTHTHQLALRSLPRLLLNLQSGTRSSSTRFSFRCTRHTLQPGSFTRINSRLQPLSLSLQSGNLLFQLQAPRTRRFSILASSSSLASQGNLSCGKLLLYSTQLLTHTRQLALRRLPRLIT
jgi:hypothetical protein